MEVFNVVIVRVVQILIQHRANCSTIMFVMNACLVDLNLDDGPGACFFKILKCIPIQASKYEVSYDQENDFADLGRKKRRSFHDKNCGEGIDYYRDGNK